MTRRIALALTLCTFAACAEDEPKPNTPGTNQPVTTDLVIEGLVSEAGNAGSAATPLSGARVEATLDRNGDGSIGGGEAFTASSGAEGTYRLQLAVSAGDTVVVGFHEDGFASVYRTLVSGPSGHVVVDAILKSLEPLECQGARCALDSGNLSLTGLPDGFGGGARVFNPVTETDAFPGNFNDDAGNLLVSGVFSTMNVEDDGGDPVETLTVPARLCMRMPRDTWPVVVDVTASNSEIDVPLYSFDEVLGTWVRDGDGVLEDGDGNVLDVSVLPDIKDGTYTGVLQACGMVSHFSSWNVDWPIASHGCVRGRIVDATGEPATGATVYLRGVTYTGTSTPLTVGDDGTFCIEAMRSEGPSEDVDNDGVNGETQTVAVRVVYQGKVYDLGEENMPTSQGTCGGGTCLELADLQLSASLELNAGLCTFSGVVRGQDGQPLAGANVYAWDESIPEETQDALCFTGTEFLCSFVTSSDSLGAFTFTAAILDSLTVYANHQETLDAQTTVFAWAERTSSGCPTTSVTLNLDQGYVQVALTVGVAGDVITWTPGLYPAYYVLVSNSTGYKWMITDESGGIDQPVTYGTIPAGATQIFPDSLSAPAALASGDQVVIQLYGTASNGLPLYGTGTFTLP